MAHAGVEGLTPPGQALPVSMVDNRGSGRRPMYTIGTFRSGFTVDPEAAERCLGEYRPDQVLHFKLYAVGPGVAIVRRFRMSDREPDVVAAVTCSLETDPSFEWDRWHWEHRHDNEDWMALVAAWAVSVFTADRVSRTRAQS